MPTSRALVLCAINYFGAYYSVCAVDKSLDASGGSVFRIMTDPAMLE
jgi:hypothetical protein